MYRRIVMTIMVLLIFSCAVYASDKQEDERVLNYFSGSYTEARKKFIKASIASSASIECFKNPNKGPKDELLYTDVVLIGSKNAKHILVIISGTHGVEGFSGSGIQTGLLQEGIASRLKPDTSIVMVHALNPYGFAHLRRFDENNIDPNRNFIDHSKPHPVNKGYKKLKDSISPKSISIFSNIKSFFKFFWFGLKNGKDGLESAISEGQYSDPQGLFYGGQSETWANKIIREITSSYLSNAERVVIVDLHTGLGSYGDYEIILNEPEDKPAYRRAKELFGDKVETTVSGESVSVHLPASLKLAVPDMLPDVEVTSVSLEFGTLSSMRVFLALRSENWLYRHGGSENPKSEKIKTKLLRAFYPNDDEWKSKVWLQGKEVIEQALSNLNNERIQ